MLPVFTPPKKRTTAAPSIFPASSPYSAMATPAPPPTPTYLHQPAFGDETPPLSDTLETGGGLRLSPALQDSRPGSIFVGGQPQYRGILDQFTNDWRARINAGIAGMNANRMSNARATINRLGVRDPSAFLGKVGQFGLTLEDLQAAANNPFSDLNAITKQAQAQRGGMIADRMQRGGIRSGGSARGARLIEEGRARSEATASQDALQALAQQQFDASEYERSQWDDFNQRSFQMEQTLAQQYQPQEAAWDPNYGGYRVGNRVYDQNGQLVRTI